MKTEEKRFRSDFKILIVGDSQSGKTSFCEKYTKDIFYEAYKPTSVSEFGFKIAEIDNYLYRINIWGLGGEDKNRTIIRIFLDNVQGFICLFDATRPDTKSNCIAWKNAIDKEQKFYKGNHMPCVLVENKIDLLSEEEQVDDTQLKEFAKENGFDEAFKCSVKQGINVKEAGDCLLRKIIQKMDELNIEPIQDRRYVDLIQMKKNKFKKKRKNSDKIYECSSGEDVDSVIKFGSGGSSNSLRHYSSIEGDLDFLNKTSSDDDAILEEELIKRINTPLEIKHTDNIIISNRKEFKVTIIGDSQTGKTSYINKLSNTISTDEFIPKFFTFDREDYSYRIELQDTPSSINNPSMIQLLINYADGIIIICDSTKGDNTIQWETICNDSNKPYIVIYNKIDLLPKEEQKDDNVLKVSVNENININKSFDCLLKVMMKHKT